MKKTNITLSIALAAVFSSSVAFAEAEVTGKIVHESAKFTTTGTTIGAAAAHDKDVFKQETSARIFIDGEASDSATYHVELNLMKDGKATTNYDSNESYTQRDALREAYVDTTVEDWSIRAGKQQVVWGTADGMKLLDMINPTDYGEMAQNQMEDSRIPVWMINAETTDTDGSEYQVIVSQPRENVFAGLNRNVDTSVRSSIRSADATNGTDNVYNMGTDTGHAFMMKGPDTITGVENGFLNIVPDLGGVASMFNGAFGGTGLSTASMNGFTVNAFEGMTMDQMAGAMGNPAYGPGMNGLLVDHDADNDGNIQTGAAIDHTNLPTNFLNNVTAVAGNVTATAGNVTGLQMLNMGFGSQFDTNLSDQSRAATTTLAAGADAQSVAADSTAFDYMGNTTFMTFDAFAGAGSQYVYDMPDNEVDVAFRTKRATKDGVNYSLNASYNYDKNPIIDLSWRNAAGVELVTTKLTPNPQTGAMTVNSGATADYTLMLTDAVKADGDILANGNYGAAAGETANLRFTQRVKRVKNIGGSFDMAIETEALGPVVIRGEALYTKDSYSPIIDKTKLSYGDMVGALEMVKGDRAKFVLGADITAMTNMMISAQFIQDSNLDFVDGANRYTADYATMHMSNGFNKGIKDKNFYSLFFSKPFGASGEHRWNNITMLEEGVNGNGKWNRLDAEFSIDDDTQATVEYNKYWGDANTQFGQLEKSSNIQVGVKYSF